MKIFTRILLGVLAICFVFGSQAASFGVLPAGKKVGEVSKGDSLLYNFRNGMSLTITDFGISSVLTFPNYNPNVKKYSPFLNLEKNNNALAARPGVKSLKTSFKQSSQKLAPTAAANLNAVTEVKAIPSLSAYPNPSKGLTRISVSPLGDDNYKIRISNAIGKVYKVIPVNRDTASETITVDLSPLPAGIYFYSLLVNEKLVETKRLILQPN